MIFVDASVLVAAEDSDDVNHEDACSLLEAGQPLATVELAVYEVTNVADARWHDPAAGRRLRERVWLIAAHGQLVRVDRQLGDEAALLSAELAISAYDAAYVAAARRLGASLASCDERDLVAPGYAELPGAL